MMTIEHKILKNDSKSFSAGEETINKFEVHCIVSLQVKDTTAAQRKIFF